LSAYWTNLHDGKSPFQTHINALHVQKCEAKSVSIVCLLDKSARRKVEITPEYTGFACPDFFIVGYGLDFNELYRTLP